MSNAQRCKFCHNITRTHEGELSLKDEELLLQLAREPNLDLVPLSKKKKKKSSWSYFIDSVDNVRNSVETYWCKRADMHGVHALLMVNERKRKISKKKKKSVETTVWLQQLNRKAAQREAAGSDALRQWVLTRVSCYIFRRRNVCRRWHGENLHEGKFT